jgi:hypothetical protein
MSLMQHPPVSIKMSIKSIKNELTSSPVTSEVVGSIPGQTHSSWDREGDSLWQRMCPPRAPVSSYIHYKSPCIVYRANNVLVNARLLFQYLKIISNERICKIGIRANCPLLVHARLKPSNKHKNNSTVKLIECYFSNGRYRRDGF